MTKPECCYACESRTVRPHCAGRHCPWVVCCKCLAVSARLLGQRHWRGGVAR